MADLIHNFTSGRMNKDLDERLVPNSEYRDALNLQVATSTSSQVGAFQNIKGNLEKKNKSYNPSTQVFTEWTTGYITSLQNAVCIGSIADNTTEYIYWFISSDTASVIASYNTSTGITAPLLVDTKGILNFTPDFLITGINILEGMLIWTDNQTEPKKINIDQWVTSTNSFTRHSQIYGRDFIEADITVIKKFPLQPPTVSAYETAQLNSSGQVANVNTNTTYSFYFTDANGDIVPLTPESGQQTLTWSGNVLPYYNQGDILLLRNGENDPLDNDTVIRLMVNSTIGVGDNQTGARVTVLSVGVAPGVTTTPIFYEVTLEQEAPFFEFKFAMFAYRWKYRNNEVSAFSPFTKAVFLPGKFDYNPSQGYNLGMVNNIRQLKLSDYITPDMPDDVVEVDLLYKDSVSNNVYVVDSFKPNDSEWVNDSFNIRTEIISSVVQSNQLLRPYDNVPRWAKAQEITANRLIYANYTQNFNLLEQSGEPMQTSLSASFSSNSILPDINNALIGVPSVKSIRTYQVGVAYMDQYGRTTPVFTSNDASIILSKSQAAFANSIDVKINNHIPYYNQTEKFTNFKYFIKETSKEYYNLSLDRFYQAEDGNIWLSFPSAERNKVDEETFLILKKEHDNDNPVTQQARYKIIAIENEAPVYLKETKINMGSLSTQFTYSGFPIAGGLFLEVDQDDYKKEFGDDAPTTSGLIMRVGDGGTFSEWYKVSSTSAPNSVNYRLTSDKAFGPDMNFTSTQPYGQSNAVAGLVLQIAYVDIQNKPEFTGRFFVKVNQDSLLTQSIVSAAAANNNNYYRKAVAPLYLLRGSRTSSSFWKQTWDNLDAQGNFQRWFIDYCRTDCDGYRNGTSTNGVMDISYSGWAFQQNVGEGIDKYEEFVKSLTSNGSLFRFVDDPNKTIYEITSTDRQDKRTYACSKSNSMYKDNQNKISRFRIGFKRASGTGGLTWDPVGTKLIGNTPNLSQFTEMEFIGINDDDDSFTTNNPAIFETEPKEATELNIYWEVPRTYDASEHGQTHRLNWSNCFSFGNGVESNRIRDDFNAPTLGNGVKASATLEEPYRQETRFNGLIFSQIFNSTSGINNLNQFIIAESITKDVLPEYGSIQKLRARDTDLVTLCEDKCLSILADKDALYNADGNTNLTSGRSVLGQAQAYSGIYGISTNPESFAEFGNRIYFADRARGVVLRLSADGLTEISNKGMYSFFNNNLNLNKDIFGSFDMFSKEYNLTLNNLTPYWQQTLGVGEFDRLNKDPECGAFFNSMPTTKTTLSFKEEVDGWTSRKSYIPESGVSINSNYYTFKYGKIWEHYANPIYNKFYGVGPDDTLFGKYHESSFNIIINEDPYSVKSFNTLNYTGSDSAEYVYHVSAFGTKDFSIAEIQADKLIPTSFSKKKGWYVNSVVTDLQEGTVKDFIDKEGKKFNYIKGLPTFFNTNCNNNVDSREFNVQGIGRASSITGDVFPTVFNVNVFINPECSITTDCRLSGSATAVYNCSLSGNAVLSNNCSLTGNAVDVPPTTTTTTTTTLPTTTTTTTTTTTLPTTTTTTTTTTLPPNCTLSGTATEV